jgi:soluble lytic murein transglycosylase-like protein
VAPVAHHPEIVAGVRLTALRDAVLGMHIPGDVRELRGARLLSDAPRPAATEVAVVKSIVRSNPRIGAFEALRLATLATMRAREHGLDPNFFAATILQESAFDPHAVSSAAALGIAQFTVETADAYGVEPLDPADALAGAARLLSSYVARYRAEGAADPYALALAAYNAGPLAVERYHGVPPYPETRDYIADIADRWARLARDETAAPPS